MSQNDHAIRSATLKDLRLIVDTIEILAKHGGHRDAIANLHQAYWVIYDDMPQRQPCCETHR